MERGGTAETAHFGVAPGEDHSTQSTHNRRTRAHRTRLFGDVQGAVIETPIADFFSRLGDGENFRVSGGVVRAFDFVVGRGNDFATAFDDGTDGHFIDAPGINGEVEGQGHEEGIITHELRWAELLEGAGECWFGR